jgi:hypothetical protein
VAFAVALDLALASDPDFSVQRQAAGPCPLLSKLQPPATNLRPVCYIFTLISTGGGMRPVGITLIGIYQILSGVLKMLFALSIMLFAGLAAKLASIAAEGNAVERTLHGFGHFIGIGILLFGLIHVAAGVGLLKMQNWARLLTLLLSAIGLVLLLPTLIVSHGLPLIFGLINLVSVFYLAMPPIKRLFHAERPALRAAA